MYIPYILILALLAIAGAGFGGLGGLVVGIPALVLIVAVGGYVLVTRGMREQISRRAGTDKIPSSAEASVNPVVDPSRPTGGTTGNAAPDSESAGRN